METPPNDVFIARWKDAQGKAHEQRFDLRERVKRSFKGEIVFVYQADKTFKAEVVNPPERYLIPPQRPSHTSTARPEPRAPEMKAAVRGQVATMCPNSATYLDMATGEKSAADFPPNVRTSSA